MASRLPWSSRVSLCPDGLHHVYAEDEAATGLRDLPADTRGRLIRKLCDIADLAFLSIGTDHWDVSTLLRLRAGNAEVFYSVDLNGVLVHHVVQSRVA
jgi:hypothetical protein